MRHFDGLPEKQLYVNNNIAVKYRYTKQPYSVLTNYSEKKQKDISPLYKLSYEH